MTPSVSPDLSSWTARRVVLATLVVLAVMLAFYLLFRFYLVLFILFVSIVIGVAIRPPVEWLYRHGMPRAAGVILVYLVLFASLAGFGLLLTPLLADQVSTIGRRLPDYYQSLRTFLLSSPSSLVQQMALQLPIQPSLPAPEQPAGSSLSGVGPALAYVVMAFRGLFIGTSILVLAFYWTLDSDRTVRSLLLRVPQDRREVVQSVIDEMEEKVGAYIRGVVIMAVSLAILASVAYLIVGLPYAIVLGVIAGLFEVLPVIGPILGAVPPVLLALSLDPSRVVWVIVAAIVIQQIENNLLVPRVMDRAVGVNAIVTILGIAAFGALFGLGGAIMAIPLAAVIQVLMNRFLFSADSVTIEQPDGRNRYSILRYEAQQLIADVRKQVRKKEDDADDEADRVEDMIEAIATDIDSTLAQTELPEGNT